MKNVLIIIGIILVVGVLIHEFMPMTSNSILDETRIEKFNSEEEFRSYFTYSYYGRGIGVSMVTASLSMNDGQMMEDSSALTGSVVEKSASPERVSETNVQVKGIDEPDIVKTDGNNIYFTSGNEIVKILAYPPEDMEKINELAEYGNLFLMEGNLMVLKYNEISAYETDDLSEIWTIEFNGSLVDARLYDSEIYLVTKVPMYNETEFPIPICEGKEIMWADVYHPVVNIGSDVIFNVLKINDNGEVNDMVSFAGKYWDTDLYMSTDNIYITYIVQKTELDLIVDMLRETEDMFPNKLIDEIDKVYDGNKSQWEKQREITEIIEDHMDTLDKDDALMIQNELQDRMSDYFKEHKRELEKTGIVQIDLDLDIQDVGIVPGHVLNQWAMDEYKGNFRIATTISRWTDAENDLYVLDDDMDIIGSVKGFGLTESIYSVRFIKDTAYVVTFRQTDPFYVMDLSDPRNPEIVGELKIPGYSSYLHPITDDLVLGIGKESSYVKISLFDVSDPSDPIEADKYMLEEYWSDILNTHHAFLLDKEHEVFFIPGSNGGYVFSYDNNDLNMEKAVSTSQVRRAIYIDDYMYIISDGEIVALDEFTWDRVGEVEWKVEYGYPDYYDNIAVGTMVK